MSDSIDRQTARALLRGSVVCDMTLPLIDIPGADMRKKLASLERYAAAGFDFVSVTVAVDDADPAEAIRLIARERRFYPESCAQIEGAVTQTYVCTALASLGFPCTRREIGNAPLFSACHKLINGR